MKKRDLSMEGIASTVARGWIRWERATRLGTEESQPPRGRAHFGCFCSDALVIPVPFAHTLTHGVFCYSPRCPR